MGGRAPRRAPDRHDRHRIRQDARLQPPGARRARARTEEPRPLPLPDEGACAGPGACSRRARSPARARGDLRRRHADRAALADPEVGEPRAHEPRHAPHRRPAATRSVGGRPAQPALRRRRRGARVPRCVRLARRECAAPPATRWRGCTDRSRSSCSPPRRSPTPGSSRRRCSASRPRRSATTRRLARSGRSRCGIPSSSMPSSESGRARSAMRRGSWRSSCSATCARSASRRAASRRS